MLLDQLTCAAGKHARTIAVLMSITCYASD